MRGGSTLITPKDYIKMLKRLASPFVSSTFSSLTGKKQELPATLKKDLASAPCLIEVKGEDWRPVAAADCVIDDHEIFAQKFAPFVAPTELKGLYSFLGARSLSQAVETAFTPEGEGESETRLARVVGNQVSERAQLLLVDLDNPSIPPRAGMRAAAAAALRDRSFTVREVPSIVKFVSFRGANSSRR